MIPKTVEMLQRPGDSDRRSASPHHTKRDKTHYQKEIEEMKNQAERKRMDGERDLPEAYANKNRMSDYYAPRSIGAYILCLMNSSLITCSLFNIVILVG